MESKKPPSDNNKDNIQNKTTNCPQDQKEKGIAPKCQGYPYWQQCIQAA